MRSFIDTNIFVYATYDFYAENTRAHAFLKNCLDGGDVWCVSYGVIYEYLRVVTEKRLFSQNAIALEKATDNVHGFLSIGNVEILIETEEHFSILHDLTRTHPRLSGKILHDVHVLTLMKEHSVARIYTADSDYHKFSGITVINPLKGSSV